MNNDQPQSTQAPNNPASAPVPVATPTPTTQPITAIATWPGAFGVYKFSKQIVMLNIGTILVLFFGNAIIQGISNIKYDSPGIEFIISIIALFVTVVYSTTLTIVWLAGIKNQKMSLAQTFNASKAYLLRIFVGSLLVGFASIASFLLFIIPFFFVFPRLLFTTFLIVDKNMDAVDAFSASWSMSKGQMGKIYGVIGATFAMLLLSITIIGIPFSIYFVIMYSAAFALLYSHVNTVQPVAVPVQNNAPATPAPVAPIANVTATQTPTPESAAPVATPPQAAPTDTPTVPKV